MHPCIPRIVRCIGVTALLFGLMDVRDAAAATSDTQKCQAKKLAAAGRYTHCRVNAEATFVRTGDAIKRADKLAKCAESFADAIGKADAKWGAECPSTPPTAALDSFLTQCSDDATTAAGGGPLPPFCGDGAINACGEECEGANFGGATCVTEGFPGGGSLACTSACVLDTSACQAIATMGCCQITVENFTPDLQACTDVSLVPDDDCAIASSQLGALPGVTASAVLAAAGTVCDGATGLCAAQRTGTGTCCLISTVSFNTCTEGVDPAGAICDLIESFFPSIQTTPFIGYRCVGTETALGTAYSCVP